MSIIDQLIQIKKSSDSNDIVNMLDEFTLYGRLSKIPALSDISKSDALKKQLPLLSKAISGDIYCLSIYMIATQIVDYLEYDIPEAITSHIRNTPDSLKQKLIIAQENTIRVDYHRLNDYQHNSMQKQVVAIYTNKVEDESRIVIITRSGKLQHIYQGSYIESDEVEADNTDSEDHQTSKTLRFKDDVIEIKVENYSLQGNNAYYFAQVEIERNKYRMMLDNRNNLILNDEKRRNSNIEIPLSINAMNRINLSKAKPDDFIQTLADIIKEAVQTQ